MTVFDLAIRIGLHAIKGFRSNVDSVRPLDGIAFLVERDYFENFDIFQRHENRPRFRK